MSFKSAPLLTAVATTGEGAIQPNGDQNLTFVAEQTGGTNATVVINGRIESGDTPHVVHTFSLTNDSQNFTLSDKWPHISAEVTAITGGTVTVRVVR